MKILICASNSLRYCPYANIYKNICDEFGWEYAVAYCDRFNLNEYYSYNTLRFEWNDNRNKLFNLFNYSWFLIRAIKTGDYDFIIVLTTGLGVILSPFLLHSSIPYILDIRDYTHEDIKAYYQIEKKLVSKAKGTVISSPGFKSFLPENEYIEIYNDNILTKNTETFQKRSVSPIVIGYVGTVAYYDQCAKLMELVENDYRFRFEIYGNDLIESRTSQIIQDKGYSNTRYFGAYKPEDKEKIIKEVDILFNAYGNDSPLLKYALSNKLTDAAVYKKVVLNSPNTYMDEILGDCSFAIDLNNDTNLNALFEWYSRLDSNNMQLTLDGILKDILNTNVSAKNKIIMLIKNAF